MKKFYENKIDTMDEANNSPVGSSPVGNSPIDTGARISPAPRFDRD